MSYEQTRSAHGSWRTASLLRRERIHLIENADCLEHNAADDLQTARAELVDRVFGRVPICDVVPVGKVNQVHGWHSTFHKRNVIVVDFQLAAKKMGLVSQTLGCLIDNFFQPGSG